MDIYPDYGDYDSDGNRLPHHSSSEPSSHPDSPEVQTTLPRTSTSTTDPTSNPNPNPNIKNKNKHPGRPISTTREHREASKKQRNALWAKQSRDRKKLSLEAREQRAVEMEMRVRELEREVEGWRGRYQGLEGE